MPQEPLPTRYAPLLAELHPRLDLDQVRVVRGSWQGSLFARLGRNWAVTFGNRIHFTPRLPDDLPDEEMFVLLSHECFHVNQYREAGFVRYLLMYGLGLVWTLVQGRGPRRHPLEVDAYAAGDMARAFWRRVQGP